MGATLNLDGQRFGRLTVMGFSHNRGKHRMNMCRCDCGNETKVSTTHLRTGHTKSCGCWEYDSRMRRYRHRVHYTGEEATRHRLYESYKSEAAYRKKSFSIPKEAFISLVGLNCFYCGLPPSNTRSGDNNDPDVKYSGLDRVDPDVGYEIYNVVPCCWICNRAKSSMTQFEFIGWLHRVFNHQNRSRFPLTSPLSTLICNS